MILITGATGTNGRELIRQLANAGEPLRALVRNPAKAENLKGLNVELFAADFDQPATLDAALKGVDKAFLLTPVNERFVEWQRAFIAAAQRSGLKQLVKFSGMNADSKSATELLRMHGQTDELLSQAGVPFTILRPSSFFQNMFWSAETIKTQGAFYLPFKSAKQSLVDVRDINSVAAKVLTSSGHEGKTYVITGPEAITSQEVAEKLSAVLGKPVQYVDVPLSAAKEGMRKAEMPDWNVRAVTELYGVFASGAAANVTDTVTKLLSRPAISFERFAEDHRAIFS